MSDLDIASALCEIIAGQNIVPTSTIATGGVAAGATVVPLTSVTGFVKGGRFDVYDGTAEASWCIDAVDATAKTVTLRTAGRSLTGLQAAHAAGALVSTNLCAFEPIRIAPMFGSGYPVVFAHAVTDASKVVAERRAAPVLTFGIEVRRTVLRAEDDVIDDNDWIAEQETATRQNLQTIQQAIQNNRTLLTSTGPHALGLGDGSSTPEFKRAWGRVVVRDDNEQFVGVLQVLVRSLAETF